MSHHSEDIICPNCGSRASGNYCSQCGQETNLHKDTFWKLVVHFVGHYFHYDSKFWQTLKVLLFSPGKLTLAYWNKQRMRYISPTSLYMFISAVYFIIAFAFADNNAGHIRKVEKIKVTDNSGLVTEVTIDSLHIIPTDNTSGANKIKAYFEKKTIKIASAHHMPTAAYLKEKLWHTVPKLMFFMIPVLAWLLKIRFSARKELDFVDHTIFALHTHCFWFSIRLFSLVEVNRAVGFFVDLIFFVIFFIYMLRAITNVYQVGRFNAAITLLGIAFAYTFALSILTVTTLALYFMMA